MYPYYILSEMLFRVIVAAHAILNGEAIPQELIVIIIIIRLAQ